MSKESVLMSMAPRHEHEERGKEAEHQRDAKEVGHAKHPHLGDRGLEQAEQEAERGELGDISGDAERKRGKGGAGRCNAPGQEEAADQREIEQELELRREIDEGEVPP